MTRLNWYKGNIHTHTTKSDGDDTPENVVRWFRRHGYDFLVLSDHNHLTLLEYGRGKRRFRRPLMIPGEEVSVNIHRGETAIHVNGIGVSRVVEPVDATEVVPTLQANVDAILGAGGIASINHPNYKWSFDHTAISQVNGASLLEVFNGHPLMNANGAPGKPSFEGIWDGVLSAGKAIFGVATDDSHNYKDFRPDLANPGRGWLMVRSRELSQDAIVEALAAGEFYASTGIVLDELGISGKTISLRIAQHHDFVYTTRFIGRNGHVYGEVVGTEAEYSVQGNEGYVRAAVTCSSRPRAWTQPVFVT
ncbi:MAG: PHP domain-containing protein [Chloroflexi bacterium]|nr:PHP domain-containing protein [Chloroflexota bacterium]